MMINLSPFAETPSQLVCPVHARSLLTPDAPAVITPEKIISYRQWNQYIGELTGWLSSSGVSRGYRVGLTGIVALPRLALIFALWRLGAVVAPLSHFTPPEQMREIAANLDLKQIIDSGDIPTPGNYPAHPSPTERFRLNGGAIHGGDDALIIMTSGSIGAGKGVLHSFSTMYYSAWGANINMPVSPGDRWLLSLPLYHVGGLGIPFRCFLGGAAVTIATPGADLAEAIPNYNISHVSLVPTQLQRLLLSPKPRTSSLKAILTGGSSVPADLIRQGLEQAYPLFTSYGSTETASQVSATPPGASPRQLLSSGKLLPFRELAIAPDGEILLKGRTLFKGYIRNGAVEPQNDPDGWFHSGDAGYIDEEGFLHVTCRKDNMFISGGENIYPEEIENALLTIPNILRALVVPLPDPLYGQRPAAFILTSPRSGSHPNASTEPDSPILLLTKKLPRFKIPDTIFQWPDTGNEQELKPNRRHFKQLAENNSSLTILFQKQPPTHEGESDARKSIHV